MYLYLYRHIIFAPSSHNKYAGESFPGIYDAMFDIENAKDQSKAWEEVKRQISIAAFTVHAAGMTLTEVVWKGGKNTKTTVCTNWHCLLTEIDNPVIVYAYTV